ncbi:MAG: hypothetical protein FKY71_13345 [Spiribacter salinus]|uniref:Uncharacterized protein n=1 Tax=Spiribacter salinus TaxID=1335746 RepID=A0A540VP77_9GAMM|nr:MAG: hypothetical protein FKY71_13345 [Spiribacter salinus]
MALFQANLAAKRPALCICTQMRGQFATVAVGAGAEIDVTGAGPHVPRLIRTASETIARLMQTVTTAETVKTTLRHLLFFTKTTLARNQARMCQKLCLFAQKLRHDIQKLWKNYLKFAINLSVGTGHLGGITAVKPVHLDREAERLRG